MLLQIDNRNNLLDESFGSWLVSKIKDDIIYNIDLAKLDPWDLYFKKSKLFESLDGSDVKTSDIVLAGCRNLTCRKLTSSLVISIANNQFVPGLNGVVVDSACKLINYGNLSISGYSIFTDSFQRIANNIDSYITRYTRSKI
jgi:hypothetical protein